ncbi:hypothetical protein GRI69_10290 [Erythrobacter vulgaris]|uniref:Uncharacterized protein n=1 Tax=Qipengyuania vulgaris TaxID=291985 RepID=A0A844XTU0_9SPHN|nr:hypothetical protein [Qipengyuania vulgaris]MXO48647.1 hypothetical protein [Qipengyuania vulgaris]
MVLVDASAGAVGPLDWWVLGKIGDNTARLFPTLIHLPPNHHNFTLSAGEIGENHTDPSPPYSEVFTDFTANLEIPR